MSLQNKLPFGIFFVLLFVSNFVFGQPKGDDIIIGQAFTLDSKILNEPRPYQVYVPLDYKEDGDPISVLYLLDGDGHFHHTTGIVSFLKSQGRIPNLMVVAIPNTGERTRDLTPKIEVALEDTARMIGAGGADNMLAFMKDELIPHIDNEYNTSPFKILVGHSLGGLFAVHSLLSEPDLFDAYISISPSMWWDDQNLVKKAEAFLDEEPALNSFFYMTMGNEDGTMLGGAMKLAALFEEFESNDFKWDFNVMDDETHGSIPHRSTYYGLESIFKDWYAVDYAELYSDGGLDGIKKHFDMVSTKLGFEMKPSESEMNILGYTLLGRDKIDEAISVFLENVRLFPKSWNVYDSAGEAYMKNKEDELAIEYYRKSIKLNPGNTNGVEMLEKLGVTINPEDLEVKLSEKEQSAYVGEYEINLGGVLVIQIDEGKLKASHPAISPQTMIYYSDNTFLLLPQKIPMKFTPNDKKNPKTFEVQMGPGVIAIGTKKD